MSRAVKVAFVLLHGVPVLTGCGPQIDAAERPRWLPQWSFPFDVNREREGAFDEFIFEDGGTAIWRVQEFCPLPRATFTAELRWEPTGEDAVTVEAVKSDEDTIEFPYVGMQIEEWDCDEIVYYADKSSDHTEVGFRGRTWGRVCVAEDGCSVDFCEGVEPNPLQECPG